MRTGSKKTIVLFGVVVLALTVNQHPTKAFCSLQDARRIAQETFPSVVMVEMYDTNGRAISRASGFFVREDVVVTNYHVIRGTSRGHIRIVGQTTEYPIAGLVGLDIQRDLALLKIIGARGRVLRLAEMGQVQTGEPIYALGNPEGFEGTISPGIISGISLRQIRGEDLIQMTAPISPGSSGGPVVNAKGDVIGVVSSTLKTGQNINFAIPSPYVALLVQSMTPATALGASLETEDNRYKASISGLEESKAKLVKLLPEAKQLERDAIATAATAKRLYVKGVIPLATATKALKHRDDCTQFVNDITTRIALIDAVVAEVKGKSQNSVLPGRDRKTITDGDQTRYVNTQHKISFQPPPGWKAEPASGDYVASYTDPHRSERFKAGLVLTSVDSGILLSDDLLVDTMLNSFASKLSGLKTISRQKTTIGGFDALKVYMAASYEGAEFRLLTVMIRVTEKDRLYIFSLVDLLEPFYDEKAAIERSIASFRVIQ